MGAVKTFYNAIRHLQGCVRCLVLETNDGWSKEVKKTAKMGWVVCFVPHGEARGGAR